MTRAETPWRGAALQTKPSPSEAIRHDNGIEAFKSVVADLLAAPA
jgi:hypothetical protein